MNFLIVAPKFVEYPGQAYHFPIGLAYISGALKQAGFQVHCLNLNHHFGSLEKVIEAQITSVCADVVMTGGLSSHYSNIKEIFQISKKLKPEILTIAGGGCISTEPELMMKSMNLDFGVIGEGEQTIVELCKALHNSSEFKQINGLIYRDAQGDYHITPKRQANLNLNSLPIPDYDGMEIEKYLNSQAPSDQFYYYPFDLPRLMPIIGSRSCPFNCTFCYHPLGNQYRERSLDNFFEEIEILTNKYSINGLCVLDELFANNPKRVVQFCQRIKQFNLKWMISLRVDGVDHSLLKQMKDAGCYYVSYGVESVDNTVLKSMKKKINRNQIKKALKATQDLGIGIQANLIFGDTSETINSVRNSLSWFQSHPEYQINLGMIQLYPGSELYSQAVENHKIRDKLNFIESGCPLINVSHLTDKEYTELNMITRTLPARYLIPAQEIECHKTGYHPYKGDIFTLWVKCPYCGCKVNFNNMYRLSGLSRIGCRKCNQRFCIPPKIFDEAKANYKSLEERLSASVQNGRNAATIGKYDIAFNIFSEINRKFPFYTPVYFDLVDIAVKRKDFFTAKRTLLNAIKLIPNMADLYLQLGLVNYQLSELEESETYLKQCLMLERSNVPASVNLVYLLINQNRWSEAESICNMALELSKGNTTLLKARYHIKLGEKNQKRDSNHSERPLSYSKNNVFQDFKELSN